MKYSFSQEWLIDLVKDSIKLKNKVYLIFDAAQNSRESLNFIKQAREDKNIFVHSLFSGTTEGSIPYEASPICIELNLENTVVNSLICQFFVQNGSLIPIFNIMLSKQSLSEFSKHLKEYLTVLVDQKELLFRWYDPRIGQYLHKILTTNQWDTFNYPIEQWFLSHIKYDYQPTLEMIHHIGRKR